METGQLVGRGGTEVDTLVVVVLSEVVGVVLVMLVLVPVSVTTG